VVIGGGITGLAAARVLTDRGARVTLLERDVEPVVESAGEAFASWKRPGAPQIRHSHAFLGRLRALLRDRYPDLLRALLDAGASELRMFNMLDSPERAFGHPGVILRSLRVMLIGRFFPERYAVPPPPDWNEVIARCEAATVR
jgi:phytoene dehydrogenase-like protein